MKIHLVYFFFVLLIVSCNDNKNSKWQLIYKNDKDGKVISGTKESLLKAIRNGEEIRIGWESRRVSDTTKSVEHFADAKFLTISNGEEVFAQIDPIIGQHPDLDGDTLSINFRENFQWSILVGTNGFSDRLNIDVLKDSVTGHRNRPTKVSWFVKR